MLEVAQVGVRVMTRDGQIQDLEQGADRLLPLISRRWTTTVDLLRSRTRDVNLDPRPFGFPFPEAEWLSWTQGMEMGKASSSLSTSDLLGG